MRIESGNLSAKMTLRVYSVNAWLLLKFFVQRAFEYSFGVIFDDILNFCIFVSVSAMISSVAYVFR